MSGKDKNQPPSNKKNKGRRNKKKGKNNNTKPDAKKEAEKSNDPGIFQDVDKDSPESGKTAVQIVKSDTSSETGPVKAADDIEKSKMATPNVSDPKSTYVANDNEKPKTEEAVVNEAKAGLTKPMNVEYDTHSSPSLEKLLQESRSIVIKDYDNTEGMRSLWVVHQYKSLKEMAQSIKGNSVGLINNLKLKIDPFKDHVTYSFARAKLVNQVYEFFGGLHIDIPSNGVNTRMRSAFPTQFDSMGMSLYSQIFNETGVAWFESVEKYPAVYESLLPYGNAYLNNLKTIEEVVTVMMPQERDLTVLLDNLEWETYITNLDSMNDYLQQFNDWEVVLDWRCQAYKGLRPEFNLIWNVPANHNYQIMGDTSMLFRAQAFEEVKSSLRDTIEPRTIIRIVDIWLSLNDNLQVRTQVAGESNRLANELQRVLNWDNWLCMMAVMLTSRWNSITWAEYNTSSPSLKLTLELTVVRAMVAFRDVDPATIRWSEIYLIINFLSWLTTGNRANDPSSVDYNYWINDPSPSPINTWLDTHNLQAGLSDAVREYFYTGENGEGWAGAGLNPGFHRGPSQFDNRYSIGDYEPIYGAPYHISTAPPLPIQFMRLIALGRALGNYTTTVQQAKVIIEPVARFLTYISNNQNNITFFCYLNERVNWYYWHILLTNKRSDNPTLYPTRLFQPEYDYQGVRSLQPWLNTMAELATTASEIRQKVVFKTGALTSLLFGYDYTGVVGISYKTAPPMAAIYRGWNWNSGLTEIARYTALANFYLPRDTFSYSQRRAWAFGILNSKFSGNRILKIVWDLLDGGTTQYPAVDGIQHYITAYVACDIFVENNQDCFGYVDHFYFSPFVSTMCAVDTNGLLYANYAPNIADDNNVLELSQQQVQDSLVVRNTARLINEAQDRGQLIRINAPLLLDYSAFSCDQRLIMGAYNASDIAQMVLSFSLGVYTYETGIYKYAFIWEESPTNERYQLLRPPQNTIVDVFPFKLLSPQEVVGMVGFAQARARLTFTYSPIVEVRSNTPEIGL